MSPMMYDPGEEKAMLGLVLLALLLIGWALSK